MALVSCTNPSTTNSTSSLSTPNTTQNTSNVLVVYFSATGHTKDVAEKIANLTNATLFEIAPKESYSNIDLNYNDESSRANQEQQDSSSRSEIANEVEDWSSYSTVYLGYPIWWDEEPRIIDTFVEQHDFAGKPVIPFCTSGASEITTSQKNLELLATNGIWLTGKRFAVSSSSDDIQSWLNTIQP